MATTVQQQADQQLPTATSQDDALSGDCDANGQPGRRTARGYWRLSVVIVIALALYLAAKAEFNSASSNYVLYVYGLAVTAGVLTTMFVALWRYQDPYVVAHEAMERVGARDGSSAAAPLVSCIVAVHNEEAIIRACVESLTGQTYKNTEVIFVDDASTDGTVAILEELAAAHPIRVISLPQNVGKKKALGAAMMESAGSIIAFSDSDSMWAADAVATSIEIFIADPDVGAVSGHCRASNANANLLTRIQDSWYEGQFSVRKAFESVFGAVTCVSGPLAVFRREAIYNFMPAWQADRFLGNEFRFATDRTLTAFVLGGARLGRRAKAKHRDSPFMAPDYPSRDWRIVYSKAAKAWTNVPDTVPRMLKQQVRWKKSFLRNMFLTGSFYWRKPFLPALLYYVHIAFVLLGPFVAFRHLVYLPMRGNLISMFLYLFGIVFIGSMFGLACKREDKLTGVWVYRPLMSVMSTLALSWLIFYSIVTIKKMSWART